MFRKNRRPRKQMEGKDERIIIIVEILILVVGAFLPIPSIRLVGRVALAACVAILFALIYRLIRLRAK